MTDAQLEHYNEHGFVTVAEITDDGTLQALLNASKRAKVKVRVGEVDVYNYWAHQRKYRTLGDSWHPSAFVWRTNFRRTYAI